MDTVVVDTGAFWQRGPPEAWEGEEVEAGDELHQGIKAWEGGSFGLQDSEQLGSADFSHGISSYGYSAHEDYAPADADPDIPPLRRGEKRRSEGLSADGFDASQAPSSPLLQSSSSKSRTSGTGSLFFKTKLCIKFKAGACPYNSSCNFAHGMDELRKPPPGWEDMVGNQDIGILNGGSSAVPSSAELLRFRRTRRCKKYFSDEGCPYGERCNFLHDDEAKARESNAISLGPTSGSVAGGNGSGNGGNGTERPSNWKTRMCNKWEMTGHCPFGQKCNFAHGLAELQMYTGAVTDGDAKQAPASGVSLDTKQAPKVVSKTLVDGNSVYTSFIVDGPNSSALTRHRGAHSSSSKSQKQMKVLTNWKGPADEISTIYGDWIEEDE